MALDLLTYDQVAQHRENSTSAVSVYSPSINTTVQAFVKIANVSDETVLCSVFHDNNGTTYNESTALVFEMPIMPGQILEIDHIFFSDETGNLAVQSSVANAIVATVYGIIRSA